MFSSLFISRPKLSLVISLVLTIMGIIGYAALPVEQYPSITPPVVNVSATYTGANAETVETSVAAVIEAEVNGVDDMIYMSSDSSDTGSYSLNVSFEVGTDPDLAAVNVQNRVAQAMSKLPTEVTNQGVVTEKTSTNMLLLVTLYSPDKTYDELFLSNYASINLKDTLARVNGVGKADIMTNFEYAMRMWMDPNVMAGLGITPGDIISAISEQNLEVSAGQIGASPVPDGQQFQYTIKARGRLVSVEEFENIVLRTGGAGSIVRMKDVARVELGAGFYSASGRYAGRPSTVLAIYQAPGANAVAVADGVKAELTRLSATFPDDVTYEIPFDSTLFVEQSLNDVISTLMQTFALVMIVVFFFLGSVRAAFIPMIAIPVSLIGTFAFLLALGMSLNTISLFALVLAIGIVVDDAIVVVEAVESIMTEEGLEAPEATRKAMGLITGPVIATTLVLLAVFVPVTFMPGITGRLYSQFAVTISIAVVISSINALTLSPALCALLLKKREGESKGILAAFDKVIGTVRGGYVGIVSRLVRIPLIGLAIVAVVVLGSGGLMKSLPAGFLPIEDNGYLFVDVQLPDAAALERTEVVTDRIDNSILDIPGVVSTVQVNGFSLLNGMTPNGAMIVANLDPWDDRETVELSADGVLAQIQASSQQEISANVIAFNPPAIQGLGNSAGVEMMVQQTGGGSSQDLSAALGSLIYAANQRPELAQVYTTFRSNVPKVFVDLDREKAKSLDVAISDIFVTLQSYMGSYYVNDFNLFGRVYKVMIQAEGEFRNNIEDIESLFVRSQTGEMVPMGALVEVQKELGPIALKRYNMFRAATVTAVPAEGLSTGDAIRVLQEVAADALPPGYTYEWTGIAQQQLDAGGMVVIIMALAVVFGYLFLVAQYESWTLPVGILLSVTVALGGALVAVWVTGGDVNLYTQIGMIMLIGMGAKNAILIVEFASNERKSGLSIRDAAVKALQERFRAVMMTALSFLLGVVPLVVASGAGAASQNALGVTAFGGMFAATILGVILTPVLFVLLQSFREWGKGLFNKKPKDNTSPTDA